MLKESWKQLFTDISVRCLHLRGLLRWASFHCISNKTFKLIISNLKNIFEYKSGDFFYDNSDNISFKISSKLKPAFRVLNKYFLIIAKISNPTKQKISDICNPWCKHEHISKRFSQNSDSIAYYFKKSWIILISVLKNFNE